RPGRHRNGRQQPPQQERLAVHGLAPVWATPSLYHRPPCPGRRAVPGFRHPSAPPPRRSGIRPCRQGHAFVIGLCQAHPIFGPSVPVMVPRLHRLLGFLLLLLLAACSASAPPRADAPASPTPLLLVSFDGVRADALGRGDTPNLDRLASGGVRAQWMRPSYPSLTFPNHYTLVTGLRPDRHGIIHNTMWDPELGEFRLNLREAVGDGRWWGGEPAWVGAHKAGLRTATMFWPGAEAEIAGVRPDRWRVFDQS